MVGCTTFVAIRVDKRDADAMRRMLQMRETRFAAANRTRWRDGCGELAGPGVPSVVCSVLHVFSVMAMVDDLKRVLCPL